jgi:MFS family permease
MDGIVRRLRRYAPLLSVYVANVFLSFHYFLVLYIHSSFLSNFFDSKTVGALFIAGSAANIILFLTVARSFRAISPHRYLLGAVAAEGVVILGLSFTTIPFLVAAFFIIQQAVVPMILFALDIYLESVNKNENVTGELRGLYLTLGNITLVISPAIVGLILKFYTFREVFLASFLFLFPLIYVCIKHLSKINVVHKPNHLLKESVARIFKTKKLLIATMNFLFLQFFYGFMVIYLPIYLNTTIGFSWSTLGLLFSIMLLPFILFEVPAGWLSDKIKSDHAVMALGFGFMAITTSLLAFPVEANFVIWAILLFLTRVGASVTEVTVESFFFKQVGEREAGEISVFRMMRPVGFITAPAVISLSLLFVSLRSTFFVVGIFTLAGACLSFFLSQ